jgi:hypothetical protein
MAKRKGGIGKFATDFFNDPIFGQEQRFMEKTWNSDDKIVNNKYGKVKKEGVL